MDHHHPFDFGFGVVTPAPARSSCVVVVVVVVAAALLLFSSGISLKFAVLWYVVVYLYALVFNTYCFIAKRDSLQAMSPKLIAGASTGMTDLQHLQAPSQLISLHEAASSSSAVNTTVGGGAILQLPDAP